MRNEFHDTLDTLVADLAEMCERASDIMRLATAALLDADVSQTGRLPGDLRELTALAVSVNDRTYRLLALQAPVARDLRTVVAALHIRADADRMGGLASHVARIAAKVHPNRATPADTADLFAEMGATAVRMADEARDAVRSLDPALTERICADDERMDELHRQLFTTLSWQISPRCASERRTSCGWRPQPCWTLTSPRPGGYPAICGS